MAQPPTPTKKGKHWERNQERSVCVCFSRSVMANSLLPMDCSPPGSSGILRQEHWSGLPLPSPGDLPDPEVEPGSPVLQEDSLASESPGKLERGGYIYMHN